MLIEEIKNKGNEIFDNKYDYSLIDVVKTKKDKFPIVCPEHGVFYKTYEHHIRRQQGCPACIGKKRHTNDDFINKCKLLEHTSEYSYENTNYINYKTKVKIYCHHKDNDGVEHGEFMITPGHFLNGEGCPKCRYLKSANSKRRSLSEVIKLANEVHNNKYDYSLIQEYKTDRINYPISCPEHGVFYQSFNRHIKGKQGCPVCGRIKCSNARRDTFEDFVRKAKLTHGEKYQYNDTNYISTDSKIGITCPTHGVFYMEPGNHITGQGCPKCFREKSGIETELFEYVKFLLPNEIIEENNRTILNGKEIDVYVPNLKVGFEMNGLVWHSEKFEKDSNYHLLKTEEALKNNVQLIQIFEDEWVRKNQICKSMVSNILGIYKNNIFVNQCVIKEVPSEHSNDFLESNHIEGKTVSPSINIGLYYKDTLVQMMVFDKQPNNCYNLMRLCSVLDTNIIGGASEIFKYFCEKYNPDEIVSCVDRRWSNGMVYETLGFQLTHISKPNYSYVANKKRINHSILTEQEYLNNKEWYKIYDCGHLYFVWKKIKLIC